MKPRTTLLGLAAIALAASGAAPVATTRPAAAKSPAAIVPPADETTRGVDGILRADDPSAAVDAFAQAMNARSDKLAVEKAYVRRMVDFGVPELAAQQAAELKQRVPTDGLAWAVSAYVHGRKGETNAALTDLLEASAKAPDEPFVLHTAGQLIAWYDGVADRNAIPAQTQTALDALKNRFNSNPAFASAYQQAHQAYSGNAAGGDAPIPTATAETSADPGVAQAAAAATPASGAGSLTATIPQQRASAPAPAVTSSAQAGAITEPTPVAPTAPLSGNAYNYSNGYGGGWWSGSGGGEQTIIILPERQQNDQRRGHDGHRSADARANTQGNNPAPAASAAPNRTDNHAGTAAAREPSQQGASSNSPQLVPG